MLNKRKAASKNNMLGDTLHTECYDSQLKNTSLRIALVLLLHRAMLGGVVGVITVAQSIFDSLLCVEAAHILGETVYGVGYFLAFAVPAWIFCAVSRKQESFRKGFYRGKLPATMPLIAFAVIALNFAAAYVNSYVLTMVFPGLESLLAVMQEEPMAWYEIMMTFFTIAVVPAICEELLFRGVILSNLLPYGRTVAIMGSGLLFGIMHENPLQIFYTSLMGITLGYVYVKTRSFWVCVLLHFLNNSVSVVQSALVGRSDVADGVSVALELTIIVVGALSVAILLYRHAKRPRPEDTGSFGVLYEPHADFAEYPVTPGKRIALFFSPAMIVYVALSIMTMVILLFTYGLSFFLV